MPAASRAATEPIPVAAIPSDLPPEQQLFRALAAFQAEATAAAKDAKNPAFHSTYATLASVLTAIQPAAKHGLSHAITYTQDEEGRTTLVATMFHVGGGMLRSTLPINLEANWQRNGSAMTYARRYALMALFGLSSADDDDDGNNAAPAPASRPRQRQQPPAPRSNGQAANGAPPPPRERPLTAEDKKAVTIATARKRCREAGLTAQGVAFMIDELSGGTAIAFNQLPDDILLKLSTVGVSDATIARWNARQPLLPGPQAQESLPLAATAEEPQEQFPPEEEQEALPLADPQALAAVAGRN